MSFADGEYHRRRAEIEMECAVSAGDRESALAHLQLARLHRARRQQISPTIGLRSRGPAIFRTDKEA